MAIGQQIFIMSIIIKLRMMRKPLEVGETGKAPELVMWSLFIYLSI